MYIFVRIHLHTDMDKLYTSAHAVSCVYSASHVYCTCEDAFLKRHVLQVCSSNSTCYTCLRHCARCVCTVCTTSSSISQCHCCKDFETNSCLAPFFACAYCLSHWSLYEQNFHPVIRQSLPMSTFRRCICPLVVTRGSDQLTMSTKFDLR
jgi:hypothetical protein